MAEKRQESHTSDGAVKITRKKKRYQLGIENISLKGLMFMCSLRSLVEKHIRFSQGLSLVCTCFLEVFIFVLLNCESL